MRLERVDGRPLVIGHRGAKAVAPENSLEALAADVPVAIGYPRDRAGVARFAWPGTVVRPARAALRSVMPLRIPPLLRQARASVLALHWTLCSPAAVRAAHRSGAPVLAWTVDDPEAVRRLAAIGVDGVVSDDPKSALATLLAP